MPFEPDITCKTLFEPKKVWILVSLELSVNLIIPFDPERCKLKVPGNYFSLYLALSIDIAQKLLTDNVLVPLPKINPAVSSSKTNDLYWP